MSLYYQDELVTLWHGSCLEIGEWLQADVLITDPPYGVAWPAGALHSRKDLRESSVQSIIGDENTEVRDEVLDRWEGKPAIVFGTCRKPRPQNVTHRLIWHKKGRHPGVSPAPIFPNDEEIYLIGGGWLGPPSPTVITTTEQRAQQPKIFGHPTPKPVGLMEHLVSKSPPGIIADPFAGSGTTLVAASNLGRVAIGCELEEAYCEIIAQRLAAKTLF